ncbi:MAG: hypothetical protein H0W44_00355 [Gammaproteobacteria bacterium]|nr:hypothetical protein [Gammaproteobacteria bacterium]
MAAVWFFVASNISYAGPMGFKESAMSMGDFSPNWQEAFVNYALTSRDAAGVEVVAMQSDDQRLEREAVQLTYTRLLKRWNLPHAQANVWLVGGIGALEGNDFSGTRFLYTPGIQLDYETTRIYLASAFRAYRAEDIDHDYASARAGFSFYEVDYDEVQPWFIVEARRMQGLSEEAEVTPMLRLIHNRYFVEAGVSNMKQARFNFMYIF